MISNILFLGFFYSVYQIISFFQDNDLLNMGEEIGITIDEETKDLPRAEAVHSKPLKIRKKKYEKQMKS